MPVAELILPVDKEHDVYTILGVILCLRHIMPHLAQSLNSRSQGLKDSFGFREMEKEEGVSTEQLLKVRTGKFGATITPGLFVMLVLCVSLKGDTDVGYKI